MTTHEWIKFIELLRSLPEDKLKEIYWITEGAAYVAQKEKTA